MDWKGIAQRALQEFRAKQDPNELADFLQWLNELDPQPKYVVEIGVYRGGNLWAMQQAARDATFIAVDLTFKRIRHWQYKCGTTFICGDSSEVAPHVRRLYVPSETLVYIDGNHAYEHVSLDALNYPANYQAFHDIKDDRRAPESKMVCDYYQEHLPEFERAFSNYPHYVGIGIRRPPPESFRTI